MKKIATVKRHSLFVKWLKIILPSFAILLSLFFFARLTTSISIPLETQFGTFALYDGKLIMDNPKLTGLSKDGEKYTISASRATQNINDNSQWLLENISANFNSNSGNNFNVQTKNALYNINLETIVFENPVSIDVTAQDNLPSIHNAKIKFQQAQANLQTGEIRSNAKVEMIWQSGNLTAQSFSAIDNGKKYIFENSVKTIFYAQGAE